jgi:predicted enzyme related to lactoylglutathione lyase
MGDYNDFAMQLPDSDAPAAGICYARGENASQPAVWMPYITVRDLDASVARCLELGGQQVTDIRDAGGAKFAVIRDPAGAAFTLIEMPSG